ncbi:SAM-dependent methyltransferase [Advenella sp. EE-W14]|uniref:class I SAM-dependent methyltransferase n=1 Tax=Advenella sp. EE-W14 TaxID=2722705 RepID=UPI00145E583E
MTQLPLILDPCCGPKGMWFDTKDSRCLFGDIRSETITVTDRTHKQDGTRTIQITPDCIFDYRNIPFPDESFWHVVFDPPHLVRAGNKSWLANKYGVLGLDWKDDLRRGFEQCFRVLKTNGTLVFKWNETQIPVREVLGCTDRKPLYGHRSGKHSKTHWIVFMKD